MINFEASLHVQNNFECFSPMNCFVNTRCLPISPIFHEFLPLNILSEQQRGRISRLLPNQQAYFDKEFV